MPARILRILLSGVMIGVAVLAFVPTIIVRLQCSLLSPTNRFIYLYDVSSEVKEGRARLELRNDGRFEFVPQPDHNAGYPVHAQTWN